MAMKRKRVYAPSSSWGAKRRRSIRKRKTFRRRVGKSVNQTSKATHGQSMLYKGKKSSKKYYKSRLWNDTLFQVHYRSVQSFNFPLTSNASYVTGSVTYYTPLKYSGNVFWTSAGGARSYDGSTIGTFKNIILRGGMWGTTFTNTDTATVNLKLYLIWTPAGFNNTLIPSSENIGWDPSCTANFFTHIGKPYWNTSVYLEPGESFKIERRVRIKKIQEHDWANDEKVPIVVAFLSNAGTNVAKTISSVLYYNLSFSGDTLT